MKKLVLTLTAVLALAAPAAFAAEHGGHAGHDMAGMAKLEGVAYEAVIDGVKTTFTVQTMKEAMAAMGMKMPAGVKDTHHISVTFKDPKSGKALTGGEVKVKLTLARAGTVTRVQVLNGKPSMRKPIEEKLRSIHFSHFGTSFPGETDHTFSLRLSNDLLWSCS